MTTAVKVRNSIAAMSTQPAAPTQALVPGRSMVRPLALAQFICSYAASNMSVAIGAIAHDLNTDVLGVQTAITLFTLTMASLMIPGSKLTDILGRKACFRLGLLIYGIGALLAAFSPGLGVLVVGYSILEGIGSALLIPPIYILVTVWFSDVKTKARYFGVVSGAGGLGAAAGPLIGGTITSLISWRASFLLQVAVVIAIIVMSRKLFDPPREGARPSFDLPGAVISAVGLFFVVLGILLSRTYGWFGARVAFDINGTVIIPEGGISPVWIFAAIGAAILGAFFLYIRRVERSGGEPLLHTRLFANRIANLGLGTQMIQWLVMQGTFFVTSVYLQETRGFNAIQTGLALSPATLGILLASFGAERFAARRPQRWLVVAGFLVTTLGMAMLLSPMRNDADVLTFAPGLLLIGIGVGTMLTSSVNIVQSSFPERDQADISGLSRSVSNLGSSFGTALVGSVLAANLAGNGSFGMALAIMTIFSIVGLVFAFLIPGRQAGRIGARSDTEPAGAAEA
jgi:MFS family permease